MIREREKGLMVRTSRIAVIVISTVILMMTMKLVCAQSSTPTATGIVAGSLYFTDSQGSTETEFPITETITIHWTALPSTSDTVSVQLYYEDQDTGQLSFLQGWGPILSGQASFHPAVTGYYYIVLYGVTGQSSQRIHIIGSSEVLVTPESVFGTAMVTLAGLAAFGTIGFMKPKRKKTSRSIIIKLLFQTFSRFT